MKPLTESFQLDVRLPAESLSFLGVLLCSTAFVSGSILHKFDWIDESIRLVATIQDGRIAHNIHWETESACRVTHLLRLIPPESFSTLWQDFGDRQASWSESLCKVPKSESAGLKLACRKPQHGWVCTLRPTLPRSLTPAE